MALHNFSWVIPDKLAGCAVPGGSFHMNDDYALSDLAELYKTGVRCLISLQRMNKYYGKLCDQTGLMWIHFPIDDFSVPYDINAFNGLIDIAVTHIKHNVPVCAHCYAGVGRTGLVLSCIIGHYLSLAPAMAIDCVRKTRLAIDTGEQEKFVYEYLTNGNK